MTAGATPTGKRMWLDPAWRVGALEWVEVTLSKVGRRVTGPVEQPHVTPWSTAMRVQTDEGAVWFKATGPGPAHEGPLLGVLRDRNVARVVLPLAVHPDRPWMLFEDAGPTLRATRPAGDGDHDLRTWARILSEYAALQRSVESDEAVAAMLAVGTPDARPERLLDGLERLLEDDQVWARVAADEREDARRARHRLQDARGGIAPVVEGLASSGIAATIQHDDLHGGNIVVGPDGDRFFDWGDAVVSHPFATLTVTFNSIAHRTGRDLDDPVFGRLRDGYLEAWADVASPDLLVASATVARDLGCIGRALAWQRALAGLEPHDMDGHEGTVAGWLMEFAERLDRPSWTS